MTATIALGIPHTPWVSERVESLDRLIVALGIDGRHVPIATQVFSDREPNSVWSQKMWRWAVSTGATHFLQLQDDAIVAPNFWPALRAMLEAVPDQIVGLEAAHPLGPEMQRTGRRWYRTRAWLIGVGYVFPVLALRTFMVWCDHHAERVASTNEDTLVSQWAYETGRDIWHPVPTIIDHDLSVPSTYANDGHPEFSMYRRPTVTWRDVPRVEALEDASYWACTEAGAPLLPGPGTQRCWHCATREAKLTSGKTGARICAQCLADILGGMLSRLG